MLFQATAVLDSTNSSSSEPQAHRYTINNVSSFFCTILPSNCRYTRWPASTYKSSTGKSTFGIDDNGMTLHTQTTITSGATNKTMTTKHHDHIVNRNCVFV